MTIRFPLLLAALLAAQVPQAQAAPASDLPRVEKIFAKHIAKHIAAYARMRSYSGRFSSFDPKWGTTASRTIQFQSPNRLAMQVLVTSGSDSYTRRIVSDGRFLWMRDSRFPARYTKQEVRSRNSVMLKVPDVVSALVGMNLIWMFMGSLPPDLVLNDPPLRLLSKPGAPLLVIDRLRPQQNKRLGHTKITYRFGPDNLLRASTVQGHSLKDKSERHWDIKLNTTLPASLFQFKPAPGAKQIEYFPTTW